MSKLVGELFHHDSPGNIVVGSRVATNMYARLLVPEFLKIRLAKFRKDSIRFVVALCGPAGLISIRFPNQLELDTVMRWNPKWP